MLGAIIAVGILFGRSLFAFCSVARCLHSSYSFAALSQAGSAFKQER